MEKKEVYIRYDGPLNYYTNETINGKNYRVHIKKDKYGNVIYCSKYENWHL